MSSATRGPTVRLVLPGRWLRVSMDDQVRMGHLLELLHEGEPAVARRKEVDPAQVARWRRAGGDQVLVRQDDPTLLTLAWPAVLPPPALFAGGEAAVRALGSHVGGRPAPVESRHGYPVVREQRDRPGAHSSTYWLAHPVSGRILAVDVTRHASDRDGLALYDAVAGSIAWPDADPLAGP